MLSELEQKAFYKRLGELIHEAREQSNITQENLANFLGLNRVSIVNIEKGRQKPQIHTLVGISSYLSIPLEKLLEPLLLSLSNNFKEELEERITKEVHTSNTESIQRIKEFYKLANSKK